MGKIECFDNFRNDAMDIVGRVSFDLGDGLRGRGYFHDYGFDKYGPLDVAEELLKEFLGRNRDLFLNAEYVLAVMWGKENSTFLDCFMHSEIEGDWRTHQDKVSSFILEDGVYLPNMKVISCRHAMRVMGREADYVESVGSLQEYLEKAPAAKILFDNPFLKK